MRFFTNRIPDIGDVKTSPGSRTEILYTPTFNGSEIVLKKSGTFDVQERIDSFAPYCDIRYMINQLKVGDASVLSTRPPMYGDFSSLPAHPVDALNLINDVERTFDALPDDVKASCNNDWRQYFVRLFASPADNSVDVPADLQASKPSDPTDSKE